MSTIRAILAAVLFAACSSNPAAPARPDVSERVGGKQFAVFFGAGATTITEDADEVLRDVAALIREFAPTRVLVAGHADTAEADPEGLSGTRADLVKQRLAALGVTAAIQARGAGCRELLIPTPAGTREAQNRRVTIEY